MLASVAFELVRQLTDVEETTGAGDLPSDPSGHGSDEIVRDPNSAYDRFFMRIAWIGGILSFSAAFIGLYMVYKHLRNYVEPVFQRYVVRVIFMIPTFALCAWGTLVVPEDSKIYLESIQGVYEASLQAQRSEKILDSRANS